MQHGEFDVIDPSSAKAVDGEVHAAGWIDQSIPRGQEAWRLVKSGTLGFSFGYLIVDAVRRDDGVREIHELDVFEVSARSTPMNAATRVTAWKAADREPMGLDELRSLEADLGLGVPGEMQKLRDEMRDQMLAVLGGTNGDRAKALRARADRVAREFAPIEVASFEC